MNCCCCSASACVEISRQTTRQNVASTECEYLHAQRQAILTHIKESALHIALTNSSAVHARLVLGGPGLSIEQPLGPALILQQQLGLDAELNSVLRLAESNRV